MHLRDSNVWSQAEVANVVAISFAHLARVEAEQRGPYAKDFVSIARALGEKPGNLLPNDVGAIGHVKPLVDRLAAVRPELLPHGTALLAKVVVLAESVPTAPPTSVTSGPEPQNASRWKARR